MGRSSRQRRPRAGNLLPELKGLRDQYADLVRQRYPNIPRRVSGYNLNYLLPEHGFDVGRALVRSEGTCVSVLEATCRLVESPPARVLLLIAYPDIYQCADHVPDVMAHNPIGLEGLTTCWSNTQGAEASTRRGWRYCPKAAAGCWPNSAADTVAAAETQASGLMEALNRSSESAEHAAVHQSRADQAGLGSARVQPRRHFLRSWRRLTLGRLGRLSRRSGKAGQILARPAPS